jgi:serine/threonine-protein kinase
MGLSAGTRLGPYEIVAPLGAGGMGEVYRAHDTRLDRDVAVKVLPAAVSNDPRALSRFEQEAKAVAALSHPNILALFDVGKEGSVSFVVTELLEGTTLRGALAKGPFPLRKALDVGLQVAEGLAAAHGKGIVHRDVKPENAFLTRDGHAKLLDFGLARSRPAPAGYDKLTSEGVVLGTVAYMSPEQARGETVDFRSDQFSLGVVLYEMLTGKRPFEGASAAEMIAAIIRDEPEPVTKLDPKLPALLGWIVQRCLSKDPEERYSSTKDLAKELQNLRAHLSEALSASDVNSGETPHLRGRTFPPLLSLTLSFPVDAAPHADGINRLALSPDGKTLVYAGGRGGQKQLFVRPLDRDEIRPIPGTEGGHFVFFSPDGQWVGFFANRKLKKVSLAGGAPITLCDAPLSLGGDWGPDGTIVFVAFLGGGLQRISASGGEPKLVVAADAEKGERPFYPHILPDGENVLFMTFREGQINRAAVVSLRTGEQRIVMEDAAFPRYLPTGHLVFTREGILFVAPFSLERLEATGPPVPLLDDLLTNRTGSNCAELTYSQEGMLVYVPYRIPQRTLVWVDRRGAVEPTPFPPGGYQSLALSPDGGRLAAISIGTAEAESLLFGDFARGTLRRSMTEGGISSLAWAPDGQRVAFGFSPEENRWFGVFWQGVDGSTLPECLHQTAVQQETPTSFSPDGSALLVQAYNYSRTNLADTRWETHILPLTGERTLRPFLQTKFNIADAHFSPDGRWVACWSNESGPGQVFVQAYPPPGPKWQISTDGGEQPCWSRSGCELFYRNGDRMMAVGVELKPTFRAGRPQPLFEGSYFSFGLSGSYDVAPDGRFLMIRPDPEESGPAHVKVVLNWFEEVKRRVPGAK